MTIGALVCVLILTALTFLRVCTFDYVDWDDPVYAGLPSVQTSGRAPAAKDALTAYVSGNYHPLTMLSHAADRLLFGLRPRPPHIVNLALHMCNVVLVLLVLRGLGTPLAGATAGALLWAVHPLRVEAVAWISGRKDLLAAFFALAAILGYQAFRRTGSRARLAFSVALFVLAVLSKATAATLPLILLAVDWLQRRPLVRQTVLEKLPYLLAAGACAALALAARSAFQGVLEEQAYGMADAVAVGAFRSVFYFLLRAVIPVTNPAWLYPEATRPLLLSGHFAAAALSLLLLAAAAIVSLRRTRTFAFGLLFFFLALSPVLPVHVLGFSADRFTYLPAVGLAYLWGELTAWLLRPREKRRVGRVAMVAAAVGAVAALLALEARARAAAWENSEALWTEAVRQYTDHGVAGRNLSLAYAYRARARAVAGNGSGALADYAAAVRLDAADAGLRNERGVALASIGDWAAAIEEFTVALDREPSSSAAAFNRGLARLALGDAAAAEADFTRALAADRENDEALLARARARRALGVWEGALADVDLVLQRTPGSTQAADIKREIISDRARSR